jgi:hypothetical protein
VWKCMFCCCSASCGVRVLLLPCIQLEHMLTEPERIDQPLVDARAVLAQYPSQRCCMRPDF